MVKRLVIAKRNLVYFMSDEWEMAGVSMGVKEERAHKRSGIFHENRVARSSLIVNVMDKP